jgi:hypothetical protein
VGPASGPIWKPLAGSEFEQDCLRWASPEDESVSGVVRASDLLVAVKSWPSSFGAGVQLARKTHRPLIVDLDEDDAAALIGRDAKVADRILQFGNLSRKGRRPLGLLRLQKLLKEHPRTVGNPMLQERFGGHLVPHARFDPGPGAPHESAAPVTAFIGTVRRHAGMETLRAGIAEVANHGHRLVVTEKAPKDARPWEEWIGQTSFSEGAHRVAASDIIACISRSDRYGPTQVPVKVVDAMLAGRVVLASDTPPLRWALGRLAS